MKNKQILSAFETNILPVKAKEAIIGGNEGRTTDTAGSTIAFHAQIFGIDFTYGYTEDADADGDWVSTC